MSQKVTEYLTYGSKHKTVVLSYKPMYTLPHDTLHRADDSVCSIKTERHGIQTDKNLKYSEILCLSEI